MGKIDLGLDFIGFGASGSRGPARSLRLTGGTEACTHLFRFMVFERTGMALLLSNSDLRKYIENRFAFNFQLPCQIVDSNLAPPPFRPPDCPAKSSYQPHINLTASALNSASLVSARESCPYFVSSEGAGSSAGS